MRVRKNYRNHPNNWNKSFKLKGGAIIEFTWSPFKGLWLGTLYQRQPNNFMLQIGSFESPYRSRMVREMRLRLAEVKDEKVAGVLNKIKGGQDGPATKAMKSLVRLLEISQQDIIERAIRGKK